MVQDKDSSVSAAWKPQLAAAKARAVAAEAKLAAALATHAAATAAVDKLLAAAEARAKQAERRYEQERSAHEATVQVLNLDLNLLTGGMTQVEHATKAEKVCSAPNWQCCAHSCDIRRLAWQCCTSSERVSVSYLEWQSALLRPDRVCFICKTPCHALMRDRAGCCTACHAH